MYKKATYLLVVDYASSYVGIAKLAASISPDVILHLRSIFERHVIPETVVSDNGPQYASYEFARFSSEEGLIHCTSGPRYPQSNDKAERTVQTVKAMPKKSVDPYGALLTYRMTSLECGYSPGQLLMGRQLRTSIPVVATLQPRRDESKQLRDRQENVNTRQTVDYDRYHRANPLSILSDDRDGPPFRQKRLDICTLDQPMTRLAEGHNNLLRRDCDRWKSTIYQ